MVSASEVLAKLTVGTTFDSYEEVKQLKEQLRTICFYPLTTKNARTVEAHNKRVDIRVNNLINHIKIKIHNFNSMKIILYLLENR